MLNVELSCARALPVDGRSAVRAMGMMGDIGTMEMMGAMGAMGAMGMMGRRECRMRWKRGGGCGYF